jgi:hypothetical protein
MIDLYSIIVILFCHWVFDFHLQNDETSKKKSSCNYILLKHVGIYSIGLWVMGLATIWYFKVYGTVWLFIMWNAIIHFSTDWVTSRATSALYKEERYHDLFVTIGAGQLVHYITLFGTFIWLTNL